MSMQGEHQHQHQHQPRQTPPVGVASPKSELNKQLAQLEGLVPCWKLHAMGPYQNWSINASSSTSGAIVYSHQSPASPSSSPLSALEVADERMRRAGHGAPWGVKFRAGGLVELVRSDEPTLHLFRNAASRATIDDIRVQRARPLADKYAWFEAQAVQLRNKDSSTGQFLDMLIERRHLFNASLHALLPVDPTDWQRFPLKVQFVNEPGMDAGGLTREFYSLIASSACVGPDALLTPVDEGSAIYKVGASPSSSLDLQRYLFFGRILGKALLDGVCPGVSLCLPLLKLLSSKPLFWHDMQYIDGGFFNSILKVFECPAEDVEHMCLDFSAPSSLFEYLPRDRASEVRRTRMDDSINYAPLKVDMYEVQLESGAWAPYSRDEQDILRNCGETQVVVVENKYGRYSVDKGKMSQTSMATGYRRPVRKRSAPEPFDVKAADDIAAAKQLGEQQQQQQQQQQDFPVSLKNGAEEQAEAVTGANLEEFVAMSAAEHLFSGQRQRISALCRGVFEVLPASLLATFEPQELALLLGGVPAVDVDEWRRHTTVDASGVSSASGGNAVCDRFWRVVGQWNDEQRSRLLRFATGSPCVPMGGFSALRQTNEQGVAFELKLVDLSRGGGASQWQGFPRGHTCFNRLDLPCYGSAEEMKANLEAVISMDMGAMEIGLE